MKNKTKDTKPKSKTHEKVKRILIDVILIVIACFVGSFSTVSIMIPNGLTSGGVTGVVRILQHYVDINFSIMYYAGSLIILILCAILLGIREARKILLLSVVYPATLFVWEMLDISLIEGKDVILAVIYCGVFSGICNGIVQSRGYSFGGSDTVAKIIKEKLMPHVPLSKVMLGVDAAVIIASAIVYGRNIAMYALVTSVLTSKVIDFYMYGVSPKLVRMSIISAEPDIIMQYVMNEIGRGVTIEKITGAYTNVERRKLAVLCSPRESVLIRNFIAEHDSKAMITLTAVDSVWGDGSGFKSLEG